MTLTAAAAIGDRVEGLNLGADDDLPKPFAFGELVARVNALARRAPAGPPVFVSGDLKLDRARRRATRATEVDSQLHGKLDPDSELAVAELRGFCCVAQGAPT